MFVAPSKGIWSLSDEADRLLVREMLDAAARVESYIKDHGGEAEFMRQGVLYDAVCLNLLRFGECARVLSDSAKARLPLVPWPDIINLRHRVAHSYDLLKPAVLWRIATVNVSQIAELIRPLEEPE